LLAWWHQGHTEHIADLRWIKNAPENRMQDLIFYGWRMLPPMIVCTATLVAGAMGLALLPVVAAWAWGRHLLWSVFIFVMLWLLVLGTRALHQPYFPPLAARETWALEELGATEPLVPSFEVLSQPGWLVWSVTAATFASFALLLAGLARRPGREQAFFWWLIAGDFLLIALLWLFYDRYALPLLPLFMAVLLSTGELHRPRLAVILVSVMGLYSFIGVRDHLSYNRALWQAVDVALRYTSISQIDGGYIVNGWLQYAHPENAPRDENGAVAVPMMNVEGGTSPYRITNHPLSGYRVIRSIPYRRWLGRSGSIYLLERDLPQN
jgi:MFS family permease